MLPNPYFLEELARLREDETRRSLKHGWHRLVQPRPAFGARARLIVLAAAVLSCGLAGLLT